MNRWMICILLFALAWSQAASPLTAQDEKKKDEMKKDEKKKEDKPASNIPDKAPDWSKWGKVEGKPVGEVYKVSETSLTLRTQTRQGNRTTNVDKEYTWNEQGMARRKEPPKFTDDKGLPRKGTPDELQKLKKPQGVPGYYIDRGDLKPGDIVELEMVRPITISAAKAKPEDLTIKYAMVIGEKAAPPKK